MIKFLRNQPALLLPELKALVLADLHLGLEHELYKSGILVSQAEEFLQKIKRLLRSTKSKKLIFLGDVKHKIPGMSLMELKQVPKFFSSLSLPVILIKGNHDGRLEKVLPKRVRICPSSGLKLGEYGFFHGNAWPSPKVLQADLLLMAHLHPVVEIGQADKKRRERVWIRGRLRRQEIKKKYKLKKVGKLEIIIFPAFNPLLGGSAVNSQEFRSNFIFTKNFFDFEKAEIFSLSGTYLGRWKELL